MNGAHLYISIKNFEELVNKNTVSERDTKRFLHMINTFHVSMIKLVNQLFNDDVYIEKLTAGKLHVVFKETDTYAEDIIDFSAAAYHITYNIFNSLNKYKHIDDFKISIGSDNGRFYNITFKDNRDEEITSVGNCANKASKITDITYEKYLSISDDIYNLLGSQLRRLFNRIDNRKLATMTNKYAKVGYYSTNLHTLNRKVDIDYKEIRDIVEQAYNKQNFDDYHFVDARNKIDFTLLGPRHNKRFNGIALYADINGFTKMFMDNDSNLEPMLHLTQTLLKFMNDTVKGHEGVRVQFQGDRISAVFHRHKDMNEDLFVNTVLCAMELVRGIKSTMAINEYKRYDSRGSVDLSVGLSHGVITASRSGSKRDNSQDNLIIGNTVYEANKAEDDIANRKEVVIHMSVYDELKKTTDGKLMSDLFVRCSNPDYYKTTKSKNDFEHRKYMEENQSRHQKENRLKPYNETQNI